MIRAVIFDLGNVLLHFDAAIIKVRLAKVVGTSIPEEKDNSFRTMAQQLERGAIGKQEFIDRSLFLLGKSALTAEEFTEIWSDIFWVNSEMLDLVGRIDSGCRLLLLSNTNALHIEFAESRFPEVFAPFDAAVYSYKANAVKPDPRLFELAGRTAGASHAECLYFDDIARFTDAARYMGFHAYQVVSVKSVRDVLRMYELIEN